jgi:hypothetical protein
MHLVQLGNLLKHQNQVIVQQSREFFVTSKARAIWAYHTLRHPLKTVLTNPSPIAMPTLPLISLIASPAPAMSSISMAALSCGTPTNKLLPPQAPLRLNMLLPGRPLVNSSGYATFSEKSDTLYLLQRRYTQTTSHAYDSFAVQTFTSAPNTSTYDITPQRKRKKPASSK